MSSPATNPRPRELTEAREHERRWPLESGGARARFLALGLGLIALYAAVCGGDYVSKVLAGSLRPERLVLAARIQPMNAAFPHLLGRIAFYERQDLPATLAYYQRAARLNPYSARYWLDLANTQQIMGVPLDARRSLDSALAADPTNPQVANEAANYYLVLGNVPMALKLLGITVRHSPEDARAAVELSWRATQDVHAVMEQVLPQSPDAYVLLLQVLMARRRTDAAEQVWQGLMSLNQKIVPEITFPYIQYLIEQGEVVRAKAAWDQLMRRDDSTRGYVAAGNLVNNGGFEEDILNGGFGWRYESNPAVSLGIDQGQAYHGSRSLSIGFEGDPVRDAGIYQFLAVAPATEYRISAHYKSEGIEGAGGPQLAVVDSTSRKTLFLSPEFNGTNPWQAVEGEFRTNADSKLVTVRVLRAPGTTRIRGRIWIDDVAVVQK